jgi:hypothetical protein
MRLPRIDRVQCIVNGYVHHRHDAVLERWWQGGHAVGIFVPLGDDVGAGRRGDGQAGSKHQHRNNSEIHRFPP